MEPDIPLVVPEVNAKEIAGYKNRGIIANPNCSTIQMVVALKPMHDAARIKRLVVSTYQSVSGAGRKAMDELSQQVAALFNGKEIEKNKFPHQIAFNCIPHIDVFWKTATPKKRSKMIDETRKILGEPNLPVTATTVRVPVFLQPLGVRQRRDGGKTFGGGDQADSARSAGRIVLADDAGRKYLPDGD